MAPARQQGKEQFDTYVYQYGVVPKTPFPEAGIESLYKTNRLWNTLVEIHNAHRAKYETARCVADGEYQAISESLKLLEQEIDAAYEAKRDARKQAGTRDPSHELIQAANATINGLKEQRRGLWESAKAARKRADQLIDKKALNDDFRQAVNEAQHVKNTGGLNANSANQVADYFRTARDKAFKEGATLRFRRFDGTGFWFFRFRTPGAKIDGISYGELFDRNEGKDGRPFVLATVDGQRRKPRIGLRVKVAGGAKKSTKEYAEFDLILHRPIPEHAQIQNAKLVRRRNGDKFSYAVSFTLRVPRVESAPVAQTALGVDIGFRQLPDGRVRVAAIGSSDGVEGAEIVEVSQEFVRRLEYVDQLKGRLDGSAEKLGVEVRPMLKAGSVLPEDHPKYKWIRGIAAAPANVTLSFEKAYKVARWLMREPGSLPVEVERAFQVWWRANGHGYRELHNLRQRALASRKEQYRNLAARLVAVGRPIGIEQIDWSVMAEAKDRDTSLSNTARSNRFLAAPSELLGAIRNAAQRQGVICVEVAPHYTSKTCSSCGEVNKALGAEEVWNCPGCGAEHDRDKNAAVNIARKVLQKLSVT